MLGRGWEDGTARIVARKTHQGIYHLQGPGGLYHSTYDYVVDVQPDSGAPTFRASLTELFHTDEREPDVGDRARVRFRPKDNAVKFDRSAIAKAGTANKEASQARWDALAGGEPESVNAGSGPGEAPLVRSERQGPDISMQALLRQREKLRAQRPGQDQAGSGERADRLEELTKLADLHDRGALTDAEFAAQKAKILGDG